MVLVDTGVWIDWLRARASAATRALGEIIEAGDAAIAPVILQEVLQGARTPEALRSLRSRFAALPMLLTRDWISTHAAAGELYARCRWAGVTPRSPHDCLIAQLAIEHRTALLHDDSDFDLIARVDRRLVKWTA